MFRELELLSLIFIILFFLYKGFNSPRFDAWFKRTFFRKPQSAEALAAQAEALSKEQALQKKSVAQASKDLQRDYKKLEKLNKDGTP